MIKHPTLMNCNQRTHRGHHRDASVLQFHRSAALEGSHITVRGKSYGIPETHGRLHSEFILESAQRRGCVVGPVTPGASSQAILQQTQRATNRNSLCICRMYYILWYLRMYA